jgi:phosphoribosylformylglycinamidine synthase
MAHRIEVFSKIDDARGKIKKKKIESMGFKVKDVQIVDAYTVDSDLSQEKLEKISSMLANSVFQTTSPNLRLFNYAVEIGYLPGVTDNIGNTAREGIEDLLKTKSSGQVCSSQIMFLNGDLTKDDALCIGENFANPLIQRINVKSYDEFNRENGMDVIFPKVNLHEQPTADLVDILNATDDGMAIIGKQGITNSDGSRRGPLALDLSYMKAIQAYFREKGRNPTDVEIESIAQTWSEHCKHTIFADSIDDIKDGLYNTFIKASTNKIRKEKGEKDFCVSVFTDNAGGIIFDDEFLVCDKAETHNSPSALDPFGGSITGIVGVNRDPMGFGLGAKPIINRYGFCFANPNDESALYKGKDKTQKMLSPRRIMDGVIEGVNVGGNCSGIPTPQGFVYFDERYKGKPLVFVGTIGLIPKKSAGRDSHEKQALPGDYIVMAGGKVGKDGIHGATFSSEAIDSGSPATAVQIGDPITQKKMSDAIIKEARDLKLYNSITDNGAGGLSCSIAEMAKESNGCYVQLEKVPLKYPGLEPWETWISESQERMTLAVPKENWNKFSDLMKRRGVEATVIGEFTDSGKCIVDYNGKNVMDVEMGFLHDGLPPRPINTTFTKKTHKEPDFECLEDLTESLHSMLRRQNLASFEFISQQYDHEVQGGSVIKPLQGRGRVNGDATVIKPVLNSEKGVVISHGINPSYSDIDTYDMAACAIDTAIRNSVAAGANLEQLALLDNFCWCSSNEKERLGQLKRAVQACYDYSVAFGTPFISGKDSMFNDFKGYDEKGNPIKISVPPTLLVSSIGVMKDARKAVSIDAKFPGDLVYVLGVTDDELGGSEYFAMKGEQETGEKYIGNKAPKVNASENFRTYKTLSHAINEELVSSAISVGRGGLGVALAKTAIASQLGMSVDLSKGVIMHNSECGKRDDYMLFSESQGRIVVTINPSYQNKFEKLMVNNNVSFGKIGVIIDNKAFSITRNSSIFTSLDKLTDSYKSTFKEY